MKQNRNQGRNQHQSQHQGRSQHITANASKSNIDYNILNELKDYILDNKNILRFTKCNIGTSTGTKIVTGTGTKIGTGTSIGTSTGTKTNKQKQPIHRDIHYNPRQKDSLFWCFYILKNGISKYEMEISNQHFVIEKQEKFKYIEMMRKSKDILKMYKIKPLSFVEDDLANSEKISIKTFFALCILEKINIILVDKRKIYETILTDEPKINIVHRNSMNYEHYIELDSSNEVIQRYRETYYRVSNFDDGLKSMTSYKVDELLDLCKKLNVDLQPKDANKKLSKKDIYEQLVLQF